MIYDMLFIILVNKVLVVLVKFSNSVYDVIVMYNYILILYCKVSWIG